MAAAGCSKSSKGTGDSNGLSEEELAMQNQQRWADGGNIPNAEENGPFKDIHFDFDSSTVRQDYYPDMKNGVKMLNDDPTLHAEIEGHCDKRGTTEYNMALGERRAKAVASLMVSFGARTNQLSTVSYGAEIPLDPSNSEDAYAKNRRAHFAVYRQGAKK